MNNIVKKFNWCLEKGKTGGKKHRGLRKFIPNGKEFVETIRIILEEI